MLVWRQLPSYSCIRHARTYSVKKPKHTHPKLKQAGQEKAALSFNPQRVGEKSRPIPDSKKEAAKDKDELLLSLLDGGSEPNTEVEPVDTPQCSGCGVGLQTTDERKLGYFIPESETLPVPEEVATDDVLQSILSYTPKKPDLVKAPSVCLRCWQLKNYGRVAPVEVTPEFLLDAIKPLRSKKALMVKVVDIIDFDGSFIPDFKKFVGSNPIIVVANKADLLPKGATVERVEKWIRECLKARHLTNVKAVKLISAYDGYGIKELADEIEYHRKGRDVYIMGQSNVGKSTFINKLIRMCGGKELKANLTMSKIPGTTLSTVGFPIGETGYLYDTPGIMRYEGGLENILTRDEYHKLIPTTRIKPVVLRIAPGTSFFLGGLARVDYIDGPPLVYFTINTANTLYVHKCNLPNADSTYENQAGALLSPPFRTPQSSDDPSFPWMVPRPVRTFKNNSERAWKEAHVDLVFHGLGWVSITGGGKPITVQVYYPEGCMVSERQPLMPYDSVLGMRPNPREHMKHTPGKQQIWDQKQNPNRFGAEEQEETNNYSRE